MSNDSPPERPKSNSSLIALLIAIAVGLVYFLNTGGMAWLLPGEYNVTLTPTPLAAQEQDAGAFAQGEAGGVPAAGAALTDTAGAGAGASATATPVAEAAAQAAPPTATAAATEAATEAPTEAPTEASTATPKARATDTPAPTATLKAHATATLRAEINGLPTIAYAGLPRQAQETIALIDKGGPFPYDRDGITFQNREGLLPSERSGYYHEYTVVTPGSSDRGARRIIEGQDGTLYYTDDHYESFSVVVR